MLTLIKNATVVTLDPKLGELDNADILVAADRIADVGRNITADTAEIIDGSGMIVMPGMVNAHIHLWEFPLRGIGCDWVSHRDYHGNMHGNLATRYDPDDVYIANLVGALNQVNSGTTTVLDWCHVLRDEAMTDAAIDALEESGIRAVFARGTAKRPPAPGERPFWETPFPAAEVRRLRAGRFASNDRLVTLAMAILGPDIGTYEVCEADIRLAREHGLLTTAHTWARKGKRRVEDGMWRLGRAGLLGPDHNIAHGNCLEDDELKMVLDAGCSVTATDFTEMLNSERVGMIGRVERQGGAVSLGTDVCTYFNSSMLLEMRHAFQHQRETDNRMLHAWGRWPSEHHATRTREALEWATLGGAKALQLDRRIGSLTPGKQADLVMIDTRSLNIYPAMVGGDPVHAIVMFAENSDIDSVMVAGRFLKRGGRLAIGEARLKTLLDRAAEVRSRIMQAGEYRYQPAPRGALP